MTNEEFLRNKHDIFVEQSYVPYCRDLLTLLEESFDVYKFKEFATKHRKMLFNSKNYHQIMRKDAAFLKVMYTKMKDGMKGFLTAFGNTNNTDTLASSDN